MKPIYTLAIITYFICIIGCSDASHQTKKSNDTLAETNSSSIPSPAIPVTSLKVDSPKEASAFLSRATFGATSVEIEKLVKLGDYSQWFQKQFSYPPTLHLRWANVHAKGVADTGDLKDNPQDWHNYSDALNNLQLDAWWDIVVHAKDQLRQRVAFALSEIFVISKYGPLITFPDARISYYDLLVENAFANFETLLQKITYHPAMGKYLSYLGNSQNSAIAAHPDENYAREVMQLFSIGLYLLNIDGTYKTDTHKKLIQSYSQKDVVQMAKVFTGLSDQNGHFLAEAAFSSHKARTSPMIAFENHHDKSEKKILGEYITEGGDTHTDINRALHILFIHPNTAPFISKRLIQRLVTSNPSPAYIKRVSMVFNDNGNGVRGDMKAVIKAILMDEEARKGRQLYPKTFGKFREPLLYISHLLRAFNAQNGSNILMQEGKQLYRYNSFHLQETDYTQQEGPLSALTVFNYFTPKDAPFSLKKEALAAPELELYGKQGIDELLMGLIHKDDFIYETFHITAELELQYLKNLLHAKQYEQSIEYLNIVLCAGNLSGITQKAIYTYLLQQQKSDTDTLARHLIALVMTSPDYALQR